MPIMPSLFLIYTIYLLHVPNSRQHLWKILIEIYELARDQLYAIYYG